MYETGKSFGTTTLNLGKGTVKQMVLSKTIKKYTFEQLTMVKLELWNFSNWNFNTNIENEQISVALSGK